MIYTVGTVGSMLIFYGCYFVKMYRQRQQGIRTDQLGKHKTGFAKGIETALKTVTCLVPVFELRSIYKQAVSMPAAVRTMGLICSILGALVFVTAVVEMKENWRAGVSAHEKTELVTTGIYRISRNPAFLAFDLLYLGILLTYFHIPLFLISVAAMVLFHLQIVNVEEPFLTAMFGASYLEYSKKVCRYIGRKV